MATFRGSSAEAAQRASVHARVWLHRHYWNATKPPAFQIVRGFMDGLRDDDGSSLAREVLRAQPIYQLWTAESVAALAAWLQRRGARRIVEVGAGDGRLTAWLQPLLPQARLVATDDGSWTITHKHALNLVRPAPVAQALKRYEPDTVLSSWMPYRVDWTPMFRHSSSVQRYVLIGEEPWGCVGTPTAWRSHQGWRRETLRGFAEVAWCRTDFWFGPQLLLHSRASTWTRQGRGQELP